MTPDDEKGKTPQGPETTRKFNKFDTWASLPYSNLLRRSPTVVPSGPTMMQQNHFLSIPDSQPAVSPKQGPGAVGEALRNPPPHASGMALGVQDQFLALSKASLPAPPLPPAPLATS